MFSDLTELKCLVIRRPVSSVGRAWDSYIANQKCSRHPRVVGSSPTSGEHFLLLKLLFSTNNKIFDENYHQKIHLSEDKKKP